MMTEKTLTRPLSEAERQLVARYHNLIYRVLHDLHLEENGVSDYYGEAALGLILAAQRYIADDSLQKYRFTTIAYSRIRNAVLRQRRRAAKQPQLLSLDAVMADGSTLYDVLPNTRAYDPADVPVSLTRAVRSHKVYQFPHAASYRKEAA